MFHDEVECSASFATTKTLANALGGRHIERGATVVVKGAQPHIVGATSLETHKVAHYVNNLGSVYDAVYCGSIYHCVVMAEKS
jgi:hypothetical protein